mgnify:CR=1 FL=1
MGYCYDNHNILCCDICGHSGGVRKYRCPWNYCSPTAACPECRKKHPDKFGKKYHRAHGCEKHHLEHYAWENERIALLTAGKAVRCSALGLADTPGIPGKVHVLFQRSSGLDPHCSNWTEGYYMSKGTYHAIPLLKNVTPDDYRQFGEIVPAPPEYQ